MNTLLKTIAIVLTGFSMQAYAAVNTTPAQPDSQPIGLVMQPKVSMKSAPKDSARELAVLWQGEWVEVRDKRMNYLEVYDHKRERMGFVKVTHIRQSKFHESETQEFLTLVRYLRDNRGSNSLGISLASAYLKAASIQEMNSPQGAEVLHAIGVFADRIASLASSNQHLSQSKSSLLSQHLEVARQYGVKFKNLQVDDRIQVCYDGEVYRQVLAMTASPEIKAQAALSLTQDTCVSPDLTPVEQAQMDVWRAHVLSLVEPNKLPEYLRNRIEMRKAAILSALSYAQSRFAANPEALKLSGITTPAKTLMLNAMTAFSHVEKSQLPDEDWSTYNNTAMRVNANRWALKEPIDSKKFGTIRLKIDEGRAGETCVSLMSSKQKQPLAKRCTYSLVWPQSATINRKKNAVALAVQPMAGWRELWVFREDKGHWNIDIVLPNTKEAHLGYVEFAGWSPNGKQILLAKESRANGAYQRRFEVVSLKTLSVERRARDASILGAFQRWQDPLWLAESVSTR